MDKFIIVGDVHLHLFTEFAKPANDFEYVNTRLENTFLALIDVFDAARANKATVVFTGDLFHERGKVRTEIINKSVELFDHYRDVPVIMIRGNHDMVSNSLESMASTDIFASFSNVTYIPTMDTIATPGGTIISAVSYGEEYAEIKEFINKAPEAAFLIGHLGVNGSKGAGHSKLDGEFTVSDLHPEKFSQVFLGHYHRAQELAPNARYLGTLVSTNFSEPEVKGYWYVEAENNKVTKVDFKPLDYPRFLTVSLEELAEVPDTNKDYYRVNSSKQGVAAINTLTDIPDNVRLDVQRVATEEARIEIGAEDTPVTIAEKWAEDNDKEHKEIIVKQLGRVTD